MIDFKIICYECGRELDAEVFYCGERGVGDSREPQPRIAVKGCRDCEYVLRDEFRKEGREELADALEAANDRIAELDDALEAANDRIAELEMAIKEMER